MKIGLAQTRFPQSAAEGLAIIKQQMRNAANNNCDLICFPESVIPGLRGVGYEVEAYDHQIQLGALGEIRAMAKACKLAVILPIEWKDERGYHLVAFVIGKSGEDLGMQIKNQIDPDEDLFDYVPGEGRQLFEMEGVAFGIVICHEGWRYPETVRWAARRGASIVFHPMFTGEVSNPDFYNGAMVCRSLENNIYFASVNYAIPNQQVTTALISPTGERLCVAASGSEELLVYEIDPARATRLLAQRFQPELVD
ncbi:carbon-nitrogen hydrolase family protein [Brevibacillus sp. HB1.1]|uniref:carbon-nitrogen hydrolase family protein n=1 Tax=Brevibacillus TaxID=55080 RepID=UPI0015750F69|nr:carbon-nitrogen hydrolase family protein [Brevibacillus sp. HB1.1]NTU31971.1 carbon-nitrogen hydrolase family protein [Brevibacillus sp. HB1.1]